jgi:hypothetical protein
VNRGWIVCALVALSVDARADDRVQRALAEQVCNAHDPACDWLATLSSLERATVQRAIEKRGYTVEPSPWGKIIGKVHVYNEDVFAEKSRVLRFFNNFHVTTKEFAIRLETVIGAGEVWDQERAEETARRLRDPLWSTVVVVIPVKSTDASQVDMLVVTRDVWSLRLNTRYTYQQSKLTDLTLALSENNFFGTRKVLAIAVDMDQGSIAMGPLFIDKNFLGQHIELRGRFDTIFNRDKFLNNFPGVDLVREDNGPAGWDYEGTQSSISVTKPLWSLASKWGGGATFTHHYATDRRFFGTSIRPVRCPLDGTDCATRITSMPDQPGEFDPNTSPDDELFPVEYAMRRFSTSVFASRQLDGSLLGAKLKHQFSLAYNLSRIVPEPLDSFAGNAGQKAAFVRAALPRRDTLSEVAFTYGFFTPKYRSLRNVQTYELAEDVRFGPDFDIGLGFGLEALGGSANYQRASASFGWTFPWCRDGFVRPAISIAGKRQVGLIDSDYIDETASAGLRIVTPTYWYARLVAAMSTATAWNRSLPGLPGPFFLGSDSGLRGYLINEFDGQRLAQGNFEIRSIPTPLWFFRVGGVIFYDVGAVPDTWKTFSAAQHLHHDVGLGFRALIPQSNRELFRFDLAFPLDNGVRTKAGSPRFIASFEQFF